MTARVYQGALIARLIFDKIESSTVFIADVTAVGQTFGGDKKLINSNVAIEYGHAHRMLGDTAILMVQNQHYGFRDDLPFDLKHKAGPFQYTLAPDASKAEIVAEKTNSGASSSRRCERTSHQQQTAFIFGWW